MIGGGARARIEELARLVNMSARLDDLVRTYSLGMRQRIGIAQALLADPAVLILDEPTNGLDPAGIQEMRELVRRLPSEFGITVFLSSHLLGEVEQVATNVGILSQGQMVFQGTAKEITADELDTRRGRGAPWNFGSLIYPRRVSMSRSFHGRAGQGPRPYIRAQSMPSSSLAHTAGGSNSQVRTTRVRTFMPARAAGLK